MGSKLNDKQKEKIRDYLDGVKKNPLVKEVHHNVPLKKEKKEDIWEKIGIPQIK